MKKVVKLTENDLIRIVKRVINELDEPEPVFTDKNDDCVGQIGFGEGKYTLDSERTNQFRKFVEGCIANSIPTIRQFHNNTNFNLPPLVKFYVGTSSTGDFKTNKKVAEKRMAYLTNIYLDAMNSFGIREDIAYKLLLQSNKEYTPSKIDRNFYDPSKFKPNSEDRICTIVISPITVKGNRNDQIGRISGGLIDASSVVNTVLFDMVEEKDIVSGIKKLETYSDIKDLDRTLRNARKGNLQSFLNDQLFDDQTEKYQIVSHLNQIAKRSGKNTIATIVGDKISIIIENKKVVKSLINR